MTEYEISYPSKASDGLEGFLKHMPPKYARRIANADRRNSPRLHNRAHDRDSILAAARVRRQGNGCVTFQTTGAGSFILFTAPEGRSAPVVLWRHLLAHCLGLAMALSAVVLPLYFALAW